jgi:hypothetical protein
MPRTVAESRWNQQGRRCSRDHCLPRPSGDTQAEQVTNYGCLLASAEPGRLATKVTVSATLAGFAGLDLTPSCNPQD